jgi:D-glycero-alpha-D-manno-heptose 1-phosphate guanylyltransferase
MTTAVVLAGGLGTRLRSVVADRPKPMAEVAGRPFLEHLMTYWAKQGIKKFILSVGYRADIIERHFGNSFEGSEVEYVCETESMGTGGALLLCKERISSTESFLLLNGDTFFSVDLQSLKGLARQIDADWVLSLFRARDRNRFLAISINNLGLISFDKLGNSESNGQLTWANGGVYWVNPRALKTFTGSRTSLSLESELFAKCVDQGQVFCGFRSDSTFVDIGIPEDYARAQTMTCFA